MGLPDLSNVRFTTQPGYVVTTQTPEVCVKVIMDAVVACHDLKYGDYDQVAFRTSPGVQQFRSLPGGRNAPTEEAVTIPCVELSFFVPNDQAVLTAVLKAIYDTHPYEEPVIFVKESLRTLHIAGLDEDNPNRYWNWEDDPWTPEQNRK